mmetsp:Transcript_64026/g.139326  ORF Transcript_64026/g.139326 Transcript_64026/m.139326 type:complete len:314 (-) Transcript_64026:182-1123(-)
MSPAGIEPVSVSVSSPGGCSGKGTRLATGPISPMRSNGPKRPPVSPPWGERLSPSPKSSPTESVFAECCRFRRPNDDRDLVTPLPHDCKIGAVSLRARERMEAASLMSVVSRGATLEENNFLARRKREVNSPTSSTSVIRLQEERIRKFSNVTMLRMTELRSASSGSVHGRWVNLRPWNRHSPTQRSHSRKMRRSTCRFVASCSTTSITPASRSLGSIARSAVADSSFPTWFRYTSEKAEPTMVTGNATTRMPMSMQNEATSLPPVETGVASPYPTVVMVTIAHQQLAGILSNGLRAVLSVLMWDSTIQSFRS